MPWLDTLYGSTALQEVGWEESSWSPELKARHCLKYLFISKMKRCDSKINKVPQIKALKLLFEAIFNDTPVPDKEVSPSSQNPVFGCFALRLDYS